MSIDQNEFKKKVQNWMFRVGRPQAEFRLLKAGVSSSMIAKLYTNCYFSDLSIKSVEKIKRGMK